MVSILHYIILFILTVTCVMDPLMALYPVDFQSSYKDCLIRKTREIVCALEVHVIYVYFDPLHSRSLTDEVVKSLSECKSAPMYVRTFGEAYSHREIHFVSVHVFVMTEANLRNILKATATIDKTTRRKMLLRYIFTFYDKTINVEQESKLAKYLFSALWEKRILNAVAVFKTSEINVLGYDPFLVHGNATIINLSDMTYQELFKNKVRNLNGLTLKISMFEDAVRSIPRNNGTGYDGVDGYIAKTMIERLNATAEYIYPQHDDLYGGKGYGSLGDVATGHTDVAFNARYIIRDDGTTIEKTNSFGRINLCIVVPKPKRISMVWNIFKTLSIYSWIAWIFIFCITIGFFYAIQQYGKPVGNHNPQDVYSFGEIVVLLFQSFFGDSLIRISRLFTLRSILIAWLIFSHLITSVFVGKLVSTLVLPRYEKDLNHLSELANTSLQIGVVYPLFRTIKSALDNKTYSTLEPKFKRLEMDYFDYLHHRPRNSAYVLRTDKAKYFLAQTYDQNAGRPTYHIMDELVALSERVYIVSPGSAFLGKINELLSFFYESGFVKYWEDMTEYRAIISGLLVRDEDAYKFDENDRIGEVELDQPKVVLTLEHLQSAFYMWILGVLVSVLAFLGEHLYCRWQRKYIEKSGSMVTLFDGYLP